MTSPEPASPAPEAGAAESPAIDGAIGVLQHRMLEAVATGQPLAEIMTLLCRGVEALAPPVFCSVLAVDQRNRLHHLASPSLPEAYSLAIDGLGTGPRAGSCGTAAYRGEAVEVTDIATDPLWADYKALALPLGLRACWSSPIKSSTGRVIGTFAFYYRTVRAPTSVERHIVEACLHHCAIAIEHEESRSRIYELAFRDSLTGLSNRACFQEQAEKALGVSDKSGGSLAIHYIDIDDFKGVNDTLGHRVGDRLLEVVAERLRSCATHGETVARLGGDEFAIIQAPLTDGGQINDLAESVISAFDEPLDIEDHKIRISASAGIARAPEDGRDLVTILRKADLALYYAKSQGRSAYRFFTPEMEAALQTRRALEHDLRVATDAKTFELYYQPIIDIASGEMVSLEALVRWRHPVRGLVNPVDFITVAEETGLIEEIGEWVLTEACTEARRWPAAVKVAVNLSSRQFRKDKFILDIVRVLSTTGLSPYRLEFEITESLLLSENPNIGESLRQLSGMGVQIALDDFGTGYSSLSYLRSFPFSKIKIDKSFVDDIDRRSDSMAIIRAVVALARDLGMRTTAEGVETAEQLRLLREEGCTEGQGFYFSRPVATAEIPTLLDRFNAGGERLLAATG